MKPVNIIGDLNIDIIFSGMKYLPLPGREITAENCRTGIGGSAANTALMLAAMDCPVKLFSRIGDDHHGKKILADLHKYGLSAATVSIAESEPTGVTVSLTYPEDRIYVTCAGTVASTRLEDIESGYISRGAYLHLTSYFLQKGLQSSVGELLKTAKQAGMITSLDPGGDPERQWDIGPLKPYLKYLDWFMPNTDEIKAITGINILEKAVENFSSEVSGMVVKNGKDGTIMKYNGSIEKFSAIATEVIDTTGAGDCFNAGFLYGLASGYSLRESVWLGNKYGAEAVASYGLPIDKLKAKNQVDKERQNEEK